MQRLKKCLGIDVGTTTVKLAEMVAEKGGVRVTRMLRGDVPLPPGPLDAARMDEIAKVVRQLISANKISTKDAVFSVPGANVFIRRIRFPRTNEERMHRIVAYEARQQIPFPPENSMMEYQVFDYGDSAEVEVLLAAIKTDVINDFMKLVNKCGLRPVMVSVTSLALFNFHVFDSTPFPDMLEALKEMQAPSTAAPVAAPAASEPVGKKKGMKMPKMSFGKKKKLDASDVANATRPEDMEGEVLQIDDLPPADDMFEDVKAYINVGSQTFDLAIARHGRRKMLGFTRSVNWAGGELTRLLTSQMGIDATQAEQVKRTEISLPSAVDLNTEPANQASEIAVKWAERMVLEVRKSFDFYIAQPDGMAVDSIVLSGGGAELPGLAAFMEDRLGVPVEVREAPQNPDFVLSDNSGASPLTSYLVSFGLAISGLGFGHVTADFLPQDLKVVREFKKKKIEVGLMAALLALIIGLSTQLGTSQISGMRQWIATNQDKLNKADQDQQALSAARGERTAVAGKITAIGQALGDRDFWLQFMSALEGMKPAGIAFTYLGMNPDGKLVINGRSQSDAVLTQFLTALNSNPDWITPGTVSAGSQRGANPAAGAAEVVFTILADVGWKNTRLAPARVTLTPGHWTPTPVSTQQTFMDPAMGGMPMM